MTITPEDISAPEVEPENPTTEVRRWQEMDSLLDHATGIGDKASGSVRPLVTREDYRAEHPYERLF